MDGAFYLIVNSVIGLLLLLFGLKLMKFAVALMGFVLGFSLISSLIAPFTWPDWMLWVIPIAAGIALAAVAFAFYRFAVTLSIALFFVNFSYGVAHSLGQGTTESWAIAIIVGLVVFFLVFALKLVDVFFALTTAAQGASLLLMVLYSLVFSVSIGLFQGYESVRVESYDWLWLIGWIGLAAVGFFFQLRSRPKHPVIPEQ